MRRLLVFVMVVLALSLPRMAQAHFVWIEARPVGKPDAPVEISLFYGEPHELLREESPGNLERDEPSVGELQGRKYDTISQGVTFSFLVEASR